METRIAEEMLGVIREERDRRRRDLEVLAGENHPYAADIAYDKWNFVERPFINELCLLLLVWVRHEVERELVWTAARVTSDGRELTSGEYREQVEAWRQGLRGRSGKRSSSAAAAQPANPQTKGKKEWRQLIKELKLEGLEEWNGAMETLRRLVNLYKHSPWATPDEDLLEHLRAQMEQKGEALGPYAADLLEHLQDRAQKDGRQRQPFQPLAESPDLMRGLAATLDLKDPTDYCDIAGEYLARAKAFLEEVRAQAEERPTWSRVKPAVASLDPERMAR
jgi:hypothetical protein